MIASTEYVKGNPVRTTARIYVTRCATEARRVAKRHQDKGRKVTFSTYYTLDPKTGERGRLIQVTVRQRPKWQDTAEKLGGFGL